jgi:fumarylacetoacetase
MQQPRQTASWVESANIDGNGFPLQNLPLCVFRKAGTTQAWRIGVGIGDSILDLPATLQEGLLPGLGAELEAALMQPVLNRYFALAQPASARLRQSLTALLSIDAPTAGPCAAHLLPQAQAEFGLPALIGDYTDFLTSFNHAFNVGTLFRPDSPVLPNFSSLPIAYHGRSSSIEVSGAPVYRPHGQFRASHNSPDIVFGASKRLDFEMELGAFIGKGNDRGHPIAVDDADAHIAGFCLLNDWSARDIQSWESQPLGPFLGKNFVSTISPWVVVSEALAPYRTAPLARRAEDGAVQDYLRYKRDTALAALEIFTEVRLSTARMRANADTPHVISKALFSRDSHWTFAQMVAHHTVNGCNLRPGDLLGSGTLSGPVPGTEGSLLELTHGGKKPLQLPGGETRTFLQDGDELSLSAFCERPGLPRIAFGECRGTVQPAPHERCPA